MCCVCGRLSGKQQQMSCISQGSAATLFRLKLASLKFANVKFPGDSVHQNLLKSVHSCRVIQNIKRKAFFETQCTYGANVRHGLIQSFQLTFSFPLFHRSFVRKNHRQHISFATMWWYNKVYRNSAFDAWLATRTETVSSTIAFDRCTVHAGDWMPPVPAEVRTHIAHAHTVISGIHGE